MENKTDCATKCCCVCHKMTGIFIILIGVAYLLEKMEVITAHVFNYILPLLIILIGLKKAFGDGKCKCCNA